MVRLAEHRAEPAHLPHQPLHHGLSGGSGFWHELSCFFSKIHKDRARFKNGDSLVSVPVDDGGNPVIRAEGQKLGLELVASPDIDPVDFIIQPQFLERNGNLVPVRGRGIVKFDHVGIQFLQSVARHGRRTTPAQL